MPKATDLTGTKKHLLTALKKLEKNKYGGWDWLFKCDCGNYKKYSSSQFGVKKSCGCLMKINSALSQGREVHGMSKSKEHKIWSGMIKRCGQYKSRGHENYAGRGIKVCERWRNSFNAFLEDMGNCPDGYSIERIDNNGNYEPKNCKWASYEEQGNNRRNTIIVEYKNEKLPLSLFCKKYGLNRHTFWEKLNKGVSVENALKPKKEVNSITFNNITKSIADWGDILGYTRTSSYRLYREGKMLQKIQNYFSHKE